MPLTENRTILERLARWRSERPVTGALLLWAASALLALIAVHPATIQITDTSLRTPLAVAGALVAFTAGFVALARPHRSTAGGTLGAVTVLVAVPAVVALGSVAGMAEMLGATVLFGGAGGVACVNWQLDRDRDSSLSRHAGTVAVLFALLVVASSGAATAGQFPRQIEEHGGFVVKLDTLSADSYDYESTEDLAINGRLNNSIKDTARTELEGVTGTNFLLSENLQQSDGTWINLQIRGTDITANGEKSLDIYVSEFYTDYLLAQLEVLVDINADEIKNYWVCNPGEASGFGSMNDVRLGIDTDPELEDGEDVYQLAHQLGSTETVIQNFELEVNRTRRTDFTISEPAPEEPSECAS